MALYGLYEAAISLYFIPTPVLFITGCLRFSLLHTTEQNVTPSLHSRRGIHFGEGYSFMYQEVIKSPQLLLMPSTISSDQSLLHQKT